MRENRESGETGWVYKSRRLRPEVGARPTDLNQAEGSADHENPVSTVSDAAYETTSEWYGKGALQWLIGSPQVIS